MFMGVEVRARFKFSRKNFTSIKYLSLAKIMDGTKILNYGTKY